MKSEYEELLKAAQVASTNSTDETAKKYFEQETYDKARNNSTKRLEEHGIIGPQSILTPSMIKDARDRQRKKEQILKQLHTQKKETEQGKIQTAVISPAKISGETSLKTPPQENLPIAKPVELPVVASKPPESQKEKTSEQLLTERYNALKASKSYNEPTREQKVEEIKQPSNPNGSFYGIDGRRYKKEVPYLAGIDSMQQHGNINNGKGKRNETLLSSASTADLSGPSNTPSKKSSGKKTR